MISILIGRNVAMLIGILSILEAGGTYIPIDPNYPLERQMYMQSHSKSDLLITDLVTYERIILHLSKSGPLPPVILVDSISGKPIDDRQHVQSFSPLPRYGNDLAYVLYTSGSTGKPKGVMVTHQGVINVVDWFAKELHIGPHSVVLGLTTFCFDISVLEMFMPLLHGGTLVIADSASQKDPYRLLDVIRERGVNVFQATPTTYEMMLATGWRGDASVDFLVGGEAFRPSLTPLVGRCKSLRNVYGPTETTIWSSCYRFGDSVPVTSSGSVMVPIGKPISQADFFLVDPDYSGPGLKQVDTEGELLIGGVGVARGYLHAPELTEERFIPSSFGIVGAVYRTGDLVRKLEDGNYVFIRRLDDQVKVNGYRIELGEVESALAAHKAVEQAVVLVRSGELVAYVKGKPGAELGEKELAEMKAQASLTLTSYMTPKFIVAVDRFPLTPNGKLDRNSLPNPNYDIEHSGDKVSVTDAETDADRISRSYDSFTMASHVVAVMERVRGVRPKTTSTFADVGVDSLGSILFLKALSDSLGGVTLDTKMMFESGATIQSFSDYLYDTMNENDPQLLLQLGITITKHSVDGDVESVTAPTRPGNHYSKSHIIREESFEDAILVNKDLLEGIRGLLTLMVLWDHFHNKDLETVDYTLAADTSLFVMLSGFTTAIQMRPMSSSVYDGKVSLTWKWQSFLSSRFVGIFPTLWLALILNAGRWKHSNEVYRNLNGNSPQSVNDLGLCAGLYVIGMQQWRDACTRIGPTDVYYASIIWNCFLFYTVARLILNYVQGVILSRYTASPGKATKPSVSFDTDSYPDKSGSQIRRLFINRLQWRALIAASIVWAAFYAVLLQLIKDTLSFAPFFFAGVTAASLVENWYWLLHHDDTTTALEPLHPLIQSCLNGFTVFLPDMLVLTVALIMCGFYVHSPVTESILRFQVIPFMAALILLFSILQSRQYRFGLLRWVAQSQVVLVIGYASYPIYLLQQVLLNYYAKLIWDVSQRNHFEITDNAWFGSQPLWGKAIGLLVLVAVCWSVQKFFNDVLVAGLYLKLISLRPKLSAILDNYANLPLGRDDSERVPLLHASDRSYLGDTFNK